MTVRNSYPDGKCPKCGEPIPKQAKEGYRCDYCDAILHEYAEVAKTENTNCLAGMKCPKCGALEPFDILAITTVMMFDDGTDPDEPQGDLEWDDESSCLCLACRHTGKVRDFKASPGKPTYAEFFKSLFDDLKPEDRKHLISDWTTHGRIVIDNKDGMPHAGDPDAEEVTT
jgi:hypothetical protein